MNNLVYGKTMKNIQTHKDIRLALTEKRRKHVMSESNYHITKFFTENLLIIEMKNFQILMNKLVYWGLLIPVLNLIV